MALQISFPDPTDATGAPMATSYWKIVGLHIDGVSQNVRITFWVYRNAASANGGVAPVTIQELVFGVNSSPAFGALIVAPCPNGIVAGLYALCHSLAQFAGAVDV